MFNIGVGELLVLLTVGFVLIGPDKLPQLARDAAQMIRTLRDLALGAREQLADELPHEFRNFNPANLNPRTAIRNVLLGDEDLSELNPNTFFKKAMGDDATPASGQSAGGSAPTQPPASPAGPDFDAT